jgi:hypothetical protein
MNARLRQLVALVVLALALVPCVALTAAPEQQDQPATPGAPPAAPSARFTSVDIYVDSGDSPLAAYQVEFKGQLADGLNGAVQLVGIEGIGGGGGAKGMAYTEPPGYDPAALSQNRVVIADFSTAAADKLPHGKTRVARLHLRIEAPPALADANPTYTATLIAAGAPDGTHIQATASVIEGEGR